MPEEQKKTNPTINIQLLYIHVYIYMYNTWVCYCTQVKIRNHRILTGKYLVVVSFIGKYLNVKQLVCALF